MSLRSLALCLAAAGLFAADALAVEPGTAKPSAIAQRQRFVMAVYQVADLVIPIKGLDLGDTFAKAGGKVNRPTRLDGGKTYEDTLVRMVRDTVAPRTWQGNGGQGTIDYYPLTMTLTVNQTPEVQKQVADLIQRVRRSFDVQVVMELLVVQVAEGFCERVGLDVGGKKDAVRQVRHVGEDGLERVGIDFETRPEPTILTERELLLFLEAAQGDRRTNVMQTPRITTINGQQATFAIADRKAFVTGVTCRVQADELVYTPEVTEVMLGMQTLLKATASEDRRKVDLDLTFSQTSLVPGPVKAVRMFAGKVQPGKTGKEGSAGETFTQQIEQPRIDKKEVRGTATVPVGHTAVFAGWTEDQVVRQECGDPTLSKVPYVGRLFKNVGYGRQKMQVLVLVTPRVVVQEEPHSIGLVPVYPSKP